MISGDILAIYRGLFIHFVDNWKFKVSLSAIIRNSDFYKIDSNNFDQSVAHPLRIQIKFVAISLKMSGRNLAVKNQKIGNGAAIKTLIYGIKD